jgi:hypothetical protein
MTRQEIEALDLKEGDYITVEFKPLKRLPYITESLLFHSIHDKGVILRTGNWANDFYDPWFSNIKSITKNGSNYSNNKTK